MEWNKQTFGAERREWLAFASLITTAFLGGTQLDSLHEHGVHPIHAFGVLTILSVGSGVFVMWATQKDRD